MLICTVTARPPTAPCRHGAGRRAHEHGVQTLALTDHDTSKACPKRAWPALSGACAGSAGRAVHLGRHHSRAGLTSRSMRRHCWRRSKRCTAAAGCAPKKSTSGWPPGHARHPRRRPRRAARAGRQRQRTGAPALCRIPGAGHVKDRGEAFRKWLGRASWATSSSIGPPLMKPLPRCASPKPG